jgi:N-acyl-L-homoserine lactone synthetase
LVEFRRAQTEDEMTAIYKLRYEVYCLEKRYLNADDYPDHLEHDEWDKYSVHFIAKSNDNIVGTVRLIKESPIGFPIEKHFGIKRTEVPTKVFAEGSRFIVRSQFRKSIFKIANGLNRCIIEACIEEGITDLYIILDERLYAAYTRIGLVLEEVGKPQRCFGCVNTPYVMPLRETLINLATNKPRMYEFFSKPYDRDSIFV